MILTFQNWLDLAVAGDTEALVAYDNAMARESEDLSYGSKLFSDRYGLRSHVEGTELASSRHCNGPYQSDSAVTQCICGGVTDTTRRCGLERTGPVDRLCDPCRAYCVLEWEERAQQDVEARRLK